MKIIVEKSGLQKLMERSSPSSTKSATGSRLFLRQEVRTSQEVLPVDDQQEAHLQGTPPNQTVQQEKQHHRRN